jgi:mRNA interferase HigB
MAMIVIDEEKIKKYGKKNAQAKEALLIWFAKVQACAWNSYSEMVSDIPSTDLIKGTKSLYVFNIKGNHYPLVAHVSFLLKTVDIRRIMTHTEYTKLNNENKLDKL